MKCEKPSNHWPFLTLINAMKVWVIMPKRRERGWIIFQDSSIVEHIRYSDAIIILDAQQLGPSTPFLESIILKKPIIFITVDDEILPFDCATDGSCIYLRSKDDLEKPLFRLLNDEETIAQLIKYGQLHLSKFLSNPGSASKKLANALISLNSN